MYVLIQLIVLCLFLAACSDTGKKLDCASVRTGNFAVNASVTGNKYFFSRTDSLQLETNGRTGDTTVLQIRWISPCVYQLLSFSEMLDNTKAGQEPEAKWEGALQVTIIKLTNEYYTFKARRPVADFVYSDTAWILK